jgi:hypothetical protein
MGHFVFDERGFDHPSRSSGPEVVSRDLFPLLAYQNVGGGYPSGKDQDGFPITNVGNDNSFWSYLRVVAGIHLNNSQDRFPPKYAECREK